MSGGSVLPRRQNGMLSGSANIRSSPASGNAPLGKKRGYVNQQAASFQRPPKKPVPVVLLSLDLARNAPYFEKARFREGAVGPSFSQRATSRVPGYGGEDLQNVKKAKTKASDQSRGESPKGQPPDHQARRRSRKETHPFPSGAKRKGESYWPARRKNAVDEDSQGSPTAKTCSSYEKKPARTKKIPKKQRQLLKQVPTRKPTCEGNRGKATWTPPCS